MITQYFNTDFLKKNTLVCLMTKPSCGGFVFFVINVNILYNNEYISDNKHALTVT